MSTNAGTKPDEHAGNRQGRTNPQGQIGSMSRDRTWALRWSYFFLVLFAIFFLMPPLYMLITSLKSSAEISAATNPWWVFHPTLSNYVELLTLEPVPALLLEFGDRLDRGRDRHHADQHARGFRAGADEVLGLGDARDRRLPHLSDPGQPAVHSAVQDAGGDPGLDRHHAASTAGTCCCSSIRR